MYLGSAPAIVKRVSGMQLLQRLTLDADCGTVLYSSLLISSGTLASPSHSVMLMRPSEGGSPDDHQTITLCLGHVSVHSCIAVNKAVNLSTAVELSL